METPTTANRRALTARTGLVVSNKMDKTITVSIVRQVKHPMYRKFIKKTMRLLAHDELEQARPGDMVRITETRPLSKRKRWRLLEIVERAK